MVLMVMRCLLEIQENRLNDDRFVDVDVDVVMCDLFVDVVGQYLNFEINVNLNYDVMVGL